MNTKSNPIPLRPDFSARAAPRNYLTKAATAVAVASTQGWQGAEAVAAELWPGEPAVAEIAKAATSPTDTTASALVQQAVGAFIAGLAPQSAAARLFEAATRIDLDGIGSVSLPRSTAGLEPAFIAEGAPIPVAQATLGDAQLGPARKMAVISVLTGEIARYSAQAAEVIVRRALTDSASVALDSAVFSTTAADATRPAGIMNGVTPIAATAGGGQAALVGDLAGLYGAFADAGLGTNVLLFANPRQAAVASILAGTPLNVVPTPALTDSIVAVDLAGFASGFSGVTEISTTDAAVIHEEDTTPTAIGTTGTPNAIAAPVRSLWQTNTIGLRLINRLAWATVTPGAAQVINSVTW